MNKIDLKKLFKILKTLKFKTKRYFFYFAIVPLYIPAFIILLIIYLLKNKYKIRFFSLSPRLGFDLPYLDFYFSFEYKKKDNIDIFFYYFVNSNNCLKYKLKKKLLFINKYLGEAIKILNNQLSKIFRYNNELLFPKSIYGNRDIYDSLDNRDANFELSEKELIKGKKILFDMGLNKDSKFICLNVRDSSFLKKKIFGLDLDYHSYRNSDIDDYLLCCEELTRLGYYVIRMGVVTEKKLVSQNSKIIDYSNSKFRSDFMDFYLGSNCEFCISTGSGFDSIPFVFRKPILYINIVPLGLLNTSSKRFLFLPKNHYCNKLNKNLSLKEIFKRNIYAALQNDDFINKDITLKDNTPEEILEASLDMINLIKNAYLKNDNEKNNLKKFSDIISSSMPKIQYENKHGEIRSLFCKSFLERNKNFLD